MKPRLTANVPPDVLFSPVQLNYLAHLYLSANHPELTIGNFIADHVKGGGEGAYAGDVLRGIRLHRMIDAFTDVHPVVEKSKRRLRPVFRKYAPVIVDVFYDHFLARDWKSYHHLELDTFASGCYSLLRDRIDFLPDRAAHMLSYMERQNWLVNYGSLDGIRHALTGLSRRARFPSNMEHAHLSLEEDYQDFQEEFEMFFPELRAYVYTLMDAY